MSPKNDRNLEHPSEERLEVYCQGRLSDPEMEEIEAHVNDCKDVCRPTLDRLLHPGRHATPSLPRAGLDADEPANDHADAGRSVPTRTLPPELGVTGPDLVARTGPWAGAPHQAAVPDPSIPGYEVLGELGRGGMGVVYKARQIKANRLVALKMILAGGRAKAEQFARFRTEAEAIARLQHPNIVQVYEVGEHLGLPFFSLEFCTGGSLDKKLAGTPQPAHEAARLVEVLARAMHAAHQAQIIHRDLKPANVLLTAEGTAKITDFGIAKKLDDVGQTQAGLIMGTPSYMAPEQAQASQDIGPSADVYALGAILYECLVGRAPFRAATSLDTLYQVIHNDPVPIRQIQPKVPRDLEIICSKCLQKDAQARYVTAEVLADDLRRFSNGEPILARPTPAWERSIKWARRRPTAAGLIGVTVLAALAFMAAIGLYGLSQSQEAALAKQQLKTAVEQEEVRGRSELWLVRAQAHEAGGRWTEAYTELAKAQEALDAQPDLEADELRAEVRGRLVVAGERVGEQKQEQQARERYGRFGPLYNNAVFSRTLFTGMDAIDDQSETRTAARAALAIYGLDTENDSARPDLDRRYLSADERLRLAGDCYELLLIWAETEAAPPPSRVEAAPPQRPLAERALALLERAARLGQAHGIETRTYYVRKAMYQAQSEGEQFDQARIDPRAPLAPTGSLDWFLEGLDLYRAGQYARARAACARAIEQRRVHFWAQYIQALCHLRTGQWVDAKADLTICSNQRPGFVWPLLLRGFAASELALKQNDLALAKAEFDAAEKDLNAAMKQDSSSLVRYVGLSNRGVLNIRRKAWEQAVRDSREATRVRPEGVPAYVTLAQALLGQGKLDEARVAMDEAIRLAPRMASLYGSRARLHARRKDRAAALADFRQAIGREPPESKSDELIANLVEFGRLLHKDRRYPEALEQYDRAIRLRPDRVVTQRFRAETLLALNREAEAGVALDRYLAVTRAVPADVYQARGLIYAGTKQLPAALEMYTLALWQNKGDTATRCYRGWTYLLTDAVGPALKDFETCLEKDETNADALAGRGSARGRLNDPEGALADARAAEKHGPLTDRLLYNLARLYANLAAQLETEARSVGPGSDRQAKQRRQSHENKAIDCLRQALERLPAEKRAAFWRDQVRADPAFAALRRGAPYLQLATRYAGRRP